MTGDRRDDLDPRLMTGAYSLDSLTAAEAAEFEAAAADSATLRAEADELQATATLLGLAAEPVTPSARLKADLMAKLGSTPQLPIEPPLVVVTADADLPPAATVPALPTAPVDPPAPMVSDAARPAEREARVRWFQRPAGILTAVAAAAALFVGGGFVGGAIIDNSTSNVVIDASASQLAELTAADDVQRQAVEIDGGGTATVVWSNELGRSAVLADGLASLPDGKVYEAWYIDSDGASAAGTFTTAGTGTSWHVLDGTMKAGDVVGVTVEPAGGSEAPTTDPIIVVQSA